MRHCVYLVLRAGRQAGIRRDQGAVRVRSDLCALGGQTFREPEDAIKAWAVWGSLMGLIMVTAPLLSSLAGGWLGYKSSFIALFDMAAAIALMAAATVLLLMRRRKDG